MFWRTRCFTVNGGPKSLWGHLVHKRFPSARCLKRLGAGQTPRPKWRQFGPRGCVQVRVFCAFTDFWQRISKVIAHRAKRTQISTYVVWPAINVPPKLRSLLLVQGTRFPRCRLIFKQSTKWPQNWIDVWFCTLPYVSKHTYYLPSPNFHQFFFLWPDGLLVTSKRAERPTMT